MSKKLAVGTFCVVTPWNSHTFSRFIWKRTITRSSSRYVWNFDFIYNDAKLLYYRDVRRISLSKYHVMSINKIVACRFFPDTWPWSCSVLWKYFCIFFIILLPIGQSKRLGDGNRTFIRVFRTWPSYKRNVGCSRNQTKSTRQIQVGFS